jgi:tetratricopeptide (TPR) repeat protein
LAERDSGPIAARIDRLQDQWTVFVRDADARVLRWVVDDDEVPFVDGFFIRESHPEASKTPDLFWTSEAPFRDPMRHGLDLRDELCASYEGARGALAEAGIHAGWTAPPMRPNVTDIEVWLETLGSFRKAHPGTEILGLCLRPAAAANAARYTDWLQRLAHAAPSELRFIVLDPSKAPLLEPLARVDSKRVRTQRAALDVPAALAELSAEAGNLETPGGQFRHLYVRLSGAAKEGDLALAEALGAKALAISEPHKWFPLSCAVHFLLGSLSMGMGRHTDAFDRFMRADEGAARADAHGDAQGKKLRVQARLSAGSALVAAQDYANAARVFTEAVPLAKDAEDPRAELDGWRLASYCHAQTGDAGKTWEAGQAALAVGRSMDPETRKTSTLKHLGESLVHWAGERHKPDVESAVRRELDALLGPEWAS